LGVPILETTNVLDKNENMEEERCAEKKEIDVVC
jgi:hypothetical protein